jgi:5-methylcytosine-specific restriction endonuclease McrA
MVLARHPLCGCGCHGPAVVADHVVPLSAWARDPCGAAARLLALRPAADTLDAWSLDNGQGMCAASHNAKTAREGG